MKETIKYQQPIEKIIDFCKGLHEFQYAPFTMNFSVRGQFVSIYLKTETMYDLINYLASQRIIDHDLANWYAEQGYSKQDVYFKRFGYTIRIARHKEKMDNNHDIKYLENKYEKEICELKSEIKSATTLISSLLAKQYNQ